MGHRRAHNYRYGSHGLLFTMLVLLVLLSTVSTTHSRVDALNWRKGLEKLHKRMEDVTKDIGDTVDAAVSGDADKLKERGAKLASTASAAVDDVKSIAKDGVKAINDAADAANNVDIEAITEAIKQETKEHVAALSEGAAVVVEQAKTLADQIQDTQPMEELLKGVLAVAKEASPLSEEDVVNAQRAFTLAGRKVSKVATRRLLKAYNSMGLLGHAQCGVRWAKVAACIGAGGTAACAVLVPQTSSGCYKYVSEALGAVDDIMTTGLEEDPKEKPPLRDTMLTEEKLRDLRSEL